MEVFQESDLELEPLTVRRQEYEAPPYMVPALIVGGVVVAGVVAFIAYLALVPPPSTATTPPPPSGGPPPGPGPTTETVTVITVVASPNPAGPNTAIALTGQAKDVGGTSVAAAELYWFVKGVLQGTVVTNASGEFEVDGITFPNPGSYDITVASGPDPSSASASATVTVVIQAQPAGSQTVTVTAEYNGNPAPSNGTVSVSDTKGNIVAQGNNPFKAYLPAGTYTTSYYFCSGRVLYLGGPVTFQEGQGSVTIPVTARSVGACPT